MTSAIILKKRLFPSALICSLGVFPTSAVRAQQVVDEKFEHSIPDPRYRSGNGPLILFD